MAVSKDEILESISNMSIMQVVELIADMEKKFGVTAAAPVAAAAAGPAAAAVVVEEQTEFTVILKEYPADKKVGVIKVVRELTPEQIAGLQSIARQYVVNSRRFKAGLKKISE